MKLDGLSEIISREHRRLALAALIAVSNYIGSDIAYSQTNSESMVNKEWHPVEGKVKFENGRYSTSIAFRNLKTKDLTIGMLDNEGSFSFLLEPGLYAMEIDNNIFNYKDTITVPVVSFKVLPYKKQGYTISVPSGKDTKPVLTKKPRTKPAPRIYDASVKFT